MTEYYSIKDRCRSGLLPYLASAFKSLPSIHHVHVLDIGCGSGVPTLWLAENLPATVEALDNNKDALNYLRHKIDAKNLQDRIHTIEATFSDLTYEPEHFDIILAEGFLNVVGFETGIAAILKILKPGGYLVIHDEFKDHQQKLELIAARNCIVTDTLYLDESVWWNDYYKQLETEIANMEVQKAAALFKTDMEEIAAIKASPFLFRSVYYVVLKGNK